MKGSYACIFVVTNDHRVKMKGTLGIYMHSIYFVLPTIPQYVVSVTGAISMIIL